MKLEHLLTTTPGIFLSFYHRNLLLNSTAQWPFYSDNGRICYTLQLKRFFFFFYFCLKIDFECTCVSACICMHCICKGCVSACVHQSLWERMRVVSNQKSLRLYSSVIIFATCNSLLRKTPSPATIFPNNIHTSPKEDLERQGLCKKGSTLIV